MGVLDNMKNFRPKNRRGISTIVGTFFFVVIMVGAFTGFFAAFQLQEDLVDTLLQVTTRNMVNLDENFVITANYDSANSNRLCVSAENIGNGPLQILDIWIVNKTGAHVLHSRLPVCPSARLPVFPSVHRP